MNQNILTALDIDGSKKSIETQIEENVIIFNKSRQRKLLKKERDLLKVNYTDDATKQILSKERIKELTEELINDKEANSFREYQKEVLQKTKENYFVMRQTLQDLNELNEFSSEIERNNLQQIEGFFSYKKLLYHSLSKLKLYHNIKKIRSQNIDSFIEKYKNKKLPFSDDPLQLLLNIRELYSIDKSIDDIDLYEKFNMESNIDMSNKLADICFQNIANGNNTSNILNELSNNNDMISKLSKNQIITNKLLGILLSSSIEGDNRTTFITNNAVSCLKTMYSTTFNNEYIYTTRTLGELLYEITNDDLKYQTKAERQQIYSTYDGTRPKTDEYHKWNGLQIFDIDLKGANIDIENLKQQVFNYLEEFNWFLWVCQSPSGKGMHIYTKVSPPHHVYTNIKENEYISQYWFNVNYNTKLSIVYDVFYRIQKDKNNSIQFPGSFFNETGFELTNKVEQIEPDGTKTYKTVGVDNVVSRITAGIRLTYDSMPLVNNNFSDLQISLNLCQTIDGFDYAKTIESVLLRDTKSNKRMITKINELAIEKVEQLKLNKPSDIDLSKFVSIGSDISDIKSLPKQSINYTTRYNVCNTLASLFGKDGLPIAHTLLDSQGCKNVEEINSFYSCAMSNRKAPSKLGLDIIKKNGIIKSIEPELKDVAENNFKNGIKKAIENSLNNKLKKATLELDDDEYLSDKKAILLDPNKGGITNSKINIILAPPGTGKTEFIKTLAKDKKRILLVLPYISVIKNKVETDESIMEMFECYYGSKDIKQIEYGINAVTTFDKFARANYEKLSRMFDYIFIDESHLLFTSSYRIEATSNVIRKIKELFFISSNDPFAAKLCLLTGTETGESYFFDNVSNVINVKKKYLNKTMDFMICDDILDCTTRMASSVYNMIQENYRILIPTNKGEIYTEKIIGMVEHLLGRQLKYGYYKRSNTDQEICRLINDDNTVGDYEVIFCSNYLSVGVDINDDVKFASIYLGPFSGYEIEQFNARVRKTGIKSIYCLQTQKADSSTNDLLLEEPDLLLRITQEDKEHFVDDKSVAKAKQEFIAQYDPVLHKITTPGFSYLNGKIQFNLEEYELISFENKYNECMQHPVKVSRELDKYGYKITVNAEFDGLDISQQEELKSIGIQAAKDEKQRKHNLLVGTFIELVQKNTYTNKHGLEFTDIIGWIAKNGDKVIEQRDLEEFIEIKFDIFATPVEIRIKSKEALDKMFKSAKYLISKYSVTKILDIINQYVDDNGILKQKQFKRSINLLKLMDSSDANELTEPMSKILDKMYDFVDQFELSKDNRISYNTYKSTVETWTNDYIDSLGIKINTMYAFEKIQDSLIELLTDIASKSTSKNGIRFNYNKLPDQDSSSVLNRRSVDSMIEKMFRITSDAIITNKIRRKNIILEQQIF